MPLLFLPFAISESVTSWGPRAVIRLKQVEAKLTEELVFSTFSFYFVNKRGWSEINEDSGIKIQLNYLNLFCLQSLEVSFVDFMANNPGTKQSLADGSNEPAYFDASTSSLPSSTCSSTISSPSRNQTPLSGGGSHYISIFLSRKTSHTALGPVSTDEYARTPSVPSQPPNTMKSQPTINT